MTEQPTQPSTPAEASAKLETLKADPTWRDAFLSGNGPQVQEFQSLSDLANQAQASNEIEAALAGRLEDGIQPTGRLMNAGVVEMLRGLEIRDDVIRQTLTGHEVTQEEFEAVKRWKADHMQNKEWTTKYLGGDLEAQRSMTLANIVLSGPIKSKEKAA